MAPDRPGVPDPAAAGVGSASATGGLIGIVDIGSNSIRLVVYDGLRRTPIPVFNEKILCGLGRDLQETGRLDPDGVVSAMVNLRRFVALADGMGVERLEAVATAAVREATDGPDFVRNVAEACGLGIQVLDGASEARLSALGVLSGIPEASGIMGDLGGGSLELVALADGRAGASVTLPLGPLRLSAVAERGAEHVERLLGETLGEITWLSEGAGQDFYPVGGAWRNLARLHMRQTDYPLRVIDHYTVPVAGFRPMLGVLMRQSPRSLRAMPEVRSRRAAVLPLGARILRRLLRLAGSRRVVFSAQGLREGMLYSRLPSDVREEDPLLAACRDLSAGFSRFEVDGEAVMNWTAPIFPDESPEQRRLRRAVCEIADVGWGEHPDYRAEHAFYKVLRLPAVGVDHPGRAFLALALSRRYGGGDRRGPGSDIHRLLDPEMTGRAGILGAALRLAFTLSGGATGLLDRAALRLADDGAVVLDIHADGSALDGDVVGGRLGALADALGRSARIEFR